MLLTGPFIEPEPFHDPALTSLAEQLILSNGGTATMWASSGMMYPREQSVIDAQ